MIARSLLLLGLCAVFGMATPAFADIAKPQKPITTSAKSKATADTFKGKKKLAAKTGKDGKKLAAKAGKQDMTEKQKAQARVDAAEKTRQAKLLALRAKAKTDANARREAANEPREKAVSIAIAKSKPVDTDSDIDIGFTPLKEKAPRGLTAERLAAQEAAAVGPDAVVRRGNNGELRSPVGQSAPAGGFFQILFGDEPASHTASMLPETRALDAVLEQKAARKKFRVKPEYEPQSVAFSGYSRGTIVIDTSEHFLYLVESYGSARRYGIAVGREGLQFKGTVKVGDKQEWPRWIPTLDMQKREPKHYGQYKDGMPGGGQNPLGARAIYLYQGNQDTHLRIHGTIAPQSIGTNASNGCFRMINEHVIDLYNRVSPGTPVVIL